MTRDTLNANPSTHMLRAPFALQSTAAGTPCIFEGYASVFDVLIDAHVPTRIKKGAFDATLADPDQRRRVKILWQHLSEEPIGKVLELREDSRGLFLRAQLSTTPRAQEAAQLLRDGIVQDLSVGFDPTNWDTVGGVRYLTEMRLWEISIVTHGANREARVTQVHRRAATDLAQAIEEAEHRYAAFQAYQLRELDLAFLEARLGGLR